jgi:hypothetical protein
MRQEGWLVVNPWLWAFAGLSLCLAAWGMVLTLGENLAVLRLILVFLGLLSAGVGVALGLNSTPPISPAEEGPKRAATFGRLIHLGLFSLFALIGAAVTVLLVLRLVDINPAGWRLNGLIILWVIICPMSVAATVRAVKRSAYEAGASEERALLLALAGLVAFCASWALYDPDVPADTPENWDTMRLALSVVFLVALAGAPLVFVSQAVRRLVVSVLILLHFCGIATAVLSAPPAPWIVQQIWGRVYQPYLEFMYLNNAYHFYAPEPGPASYLWFRMYYEDPEGKLWAHWRKIPDITLQGWHNNTLALEYQRMLALTENVVPADPTPSQLKKDKGGIAYDDWYARRLEHSPSPPVLGRVAPEGLLVPYPLHIPIEKQYLQPNNSSLVLLSSFARHVCREKHPEHPEWKVNSVKIYRVVHMIPLVGTFVAERMDPRDPVNYWPYYMGKYSPQGELLDRRLVDAEGKVINPGDPFLFWLLPNERQHPSHLLKSPINCWALRHADDDDWIYTFDETLGRHLRDEERALLKKDQK